MPKVALITFLLLFAKVVFCNSVYAKDCEKISRLYLGLGTVSTECYGEPITSVDVSSKAIILQAKEHPAGVNYKIKGGCDKCTLIVAGENLKNQATIRYSINGAHNYLPFKDGINKIPVSNLKDLEVLIYQDSDFKIKLTGLMLVQEGEFAADLEKTKAVKLGNYEINEEKELLKRLLFSSLGEMAGISDLEKTKKILSHLASYSIIETNYYGATKERFRAAVVYQGYSAGIGQLCNGLADAAIGIFNIYGIQTRRIRGQSIVANNEFYDEWVKKYGAIQSHSTVEVLIDGEWIIADPTYFMMAKYNGKYISLSQGLDLFISGRSNEIVFEQISQRNTVSNYFSGKVDKYWQDLMFSNYIVYQPFHKYPYDDVYSVYASTPRGNQTVSFYTGDIVIDEVSHLPVSWENLLRE